MSVTFKNSGKTLIAFINGDIDHHTAADIRESIDKKIERQNCKNLIIDFSKVSFMDSSGIGMVIGRYKLLQKSGGGVSICAMGKTVWKIFELSGLKKIIKSFNTVDEALKSVQ